MKTIVVFAIAAAFVWGMLIGRGWGPTTKSASYTFPTGYEVLESANNYRNEISLPPFELNHRLCNNIAKRWDNYKETDSHDGLHEFVEEYMSDMNPVSEILAWGNTADEVVSKWASSPSHDLMLRRNSKACAYSADGFSVMLLSL